MNAVPALGLWEIGKPKAGIVGNRQPGPEPRFLFKHRYLGQENPSWSALFEVTWDGPVTPQASEIAWGAFLTLDELVARIDQWPFVPDGLEIFRRWRAGDF